ncbi:hypothetical protein CMQ_4548 [Grosmannia clavigera kw1407]|uniref:Uncharacterized protein n=1 Tax=Grosmannia clavigera (strain kw1407 / UAMH 11150) TaxID=655863 RepID=F0XV56_GROCL|nr:uncharacterized protein CMQ_4548 [Grosmannia clavigera kw1407]EFW98696.1 hypothetical protein CMQ_4548 [Grosmannia clavigera kw1407]
MGAAVNLTGTVQEVVSQLINLDPAYESYFNETKEFFGPLYGPLFFPWPSASGLSRDSEARIESSEIVVDSSLRVSVHNYGAGGTGY